MGIIILDVDFRIFMMNKSAATLFDVDPLEVEDRPIETLVPENRRHITRKLLTRAVAITRPLEYRVRRAEGRAKRCLSIVVDPIRCGYQVDGVCLWVRDMTRRMELEKHLAEIEKLASLGQLAGGLAHHFNNIFGGIVTAVDYALGTDDPTTSKRTLLMISEGINKAVTLTRKLLEFSTPELPEQNLVDLTEAIISFVEQVEPRLARADRQIELDIRSVPIIPVHPGKMRQILDALLANSEQAFGKGPGKIKITLETGDQHVRLSFHDNGPGIPAQIIDRIFDPFFTTRGSLGGGCEGNLGLGLTLARRLAEDIGGNLIYSPEDSKNGSCFVITFALSNESESLQKNL